MAHRTFESLAFCFLCVEWCCSFYCLYLGCVYVGRVGEVCFDGIDECCLCGFFALEGFEDVVVDGVCGGEVDDGDGVCLSLPVEACVGLFVEFE